MNGDTLFEAQAALELITKIIRAIDTEECASPETKTDLNVLKSWAQERLMNQISLRVVAEVEAYESAQEHETSPDLLPREAKDILPN